MILVNYVRSDIMKKVIIGILIVIGLTILGILCYVFRDYLFQKGLDTNEVNYRDVTKQTNKNKFKSVLPVDFETQKGNILEKQ